jgi:RimJ/RimL family protein N-acetyltransferase
VPRTHLRARPRRNRAAHVAPGREYIALEASYQPDDGESRRVLAKNGFIVLGYARDYLFLNGAWRDGVLVSLTNDAWVPAQAP